MLKISSHLANSSLVLVRKQLSDGTTAALILMRTPARQYAEQYFKETCPQPPPRRKSRKLLFTTIGATLLTGAAIVYAKNSPETRSWLEMNVPIANKVVAIVYQEEQTYWEFASSNVSKIYTAISEFIFGKEGIAPLNFKQRSEQDLEEDACVAFKTRHYELPPPMLEPLYVEEVVLEEPEIQAQATSVFTEECEPQPALVVAVTKDHVQLEKDMHIGTKTAIETYRAAFKALQEYNEALFKIVDAPYAALGKKDFDALKASRQKRDEVLATAKQAAAKAMCAIETLDRLIRKGELQAPMENLTVTKRYIQVFRDDLSQIENQVEAEIEKSDIAEKYWHKIEEARIAYKHELETIFPGIDLCARKLDIRGDADLLLCYTMKQIQFLQNELAKMQTVTEAKIAKAIACKDDKLLIEVKAEDMARQEKLKMEEEYMKKVLAMELEFSKKFKQEMQKQFEYQENMMKSRIDYKEREINRRMARATSEEVAKERIKFKKELAQVSGKLQAIEQTLKQRAQLDAEIKRSQALWAAAEGLLAATRRQERQVSVHNELKAVENAGKNDKMVGTVLKGVPKEAYEKPIATESALKSRFDTLEKVAIQTALIGREGASLPMYFISWVQSKLIFPKLAEIPKDELNNKPVDFSQLDTFDIIQRARYHMDRGDLHATIRYVNLLQGAPRAAAKCWLEDARVYMEVKQAAEAVMAHATLSSTNANR